MGSKYLLLSYSLTPVHIGAGRSPGVVDLPFQRDSLGYPIVFGSSFKGVLKSRLILEGKKEKEAKCAFGSEPEEESSMGRLLVADLIPAFYPAPSMTEGYIYVTDEYLIKRIEDLISAVDKKSLNLYSENKSGSKEPIFVGMEKYDYEYELIPNDVIKFLGKLVKDKIYVFSEKIGQSIIESSLIRVSRNVLDKKSKKSSNLWSEEYVPAGTVFVGALIDGERTNPFCDNIDVDGLIKEFDNMSVFLGGKESVGKGLLKIKVVV